MAKPRVKHSIKRANLRDLALAAETRQARGARAARDCRRTHGSRCRARRADATRSCSVRPARRARRASRTSTDLSAQDDERRHSVSPCRAVERVNGDVGRRTLRAGRQLDFRGLGHERQRGVRADRHDLDLRRVWVIRARTSTLSTRSCATTSSPAAGSLIYRSERLLRFRRAGSTTCVAVSESADPAGAWNLYDYDLRRYLTTNPRLGVWPDGYYLSFDALDPAPSRPLGAAVVAFDRTAMLGGNEADRPRLLPSRGSRAWPSRTSTAERAPPEGAPNHMAAPGQTAWDGSRAPVLHMFDFHADFDDPESSTIAGPFDVSVPDFNPRPLRVRRGLHPRARRRPVNPTAGSLMHGMQYRNYGTHESMVVSQTVNVADGGDLARHPFLRSPHGADRARRRAVAVHALPGGHVLAERDQPLRPFDRIGRERQHRSWATASRMPRAIRRSVSPAASRAILPGRWVRRAS